MDEPFRHKASLTGRSPVLACAAAVQRTDHNARADVNSGRPVRARLCRRPQHGHLTCVPTCMSHSASRTNHTYRFKRSGCAIALGRHLRIDSETTAADVRQLCTDTCVSTQGPPQRTVVAARLHRPGKPVRYFGTPHYNPWDLALMPRASPDILTPLSYPDTRHTVQASLADLRDPSDSSLAGTPHIPGKPVRYEVSPRPEPSRTPYRPGKPVRYSVRFDRSPCLELDDVAAMQLQYPAGPRCHGAPERTEALFGRPASRHGPHIGTGPTTAMQSQKESRQRPFAQVKDSRSNPVLPTLDKPETGCNPRGKAHNKGGRESGARLLRIGRRS